MKSYHFDLGNSNDGPIGMCIRVDAESKEEALAKVREQLPDVVCVHDAIDGYAHVYINVDKITVDDIDDEEEIEDE